MVWLNDVRELLNDVIIHTTRYRCVSLQWGLVLRRTDGRGLLTVLSSLRRTKESSPSSRLLRESRLLAFRWGLTRGLARAA